MALNPAHMAIWIALFGSMWFTGLVGGRHPGANAEFWKRACEEGRPGACRTWVRTTNVACRHGSGLACYQLGLALDEGAVVARDASEAGMNFARACDLKTVGACPSLVGLFRKEGDGIFQRPCDAGDGESCFVLGSLQYSARNFARSAALFRKACDSGWPRGCGGLGELYRATDTPQAIQYFERACRAGIAASCYSLGGLYRAKDEALAGKRLREACDLSLRAATDNAAYFRASSGQGEMTAPFCSQAAP
jgi:TPR repeat protein